MRIWDAVKIAAAIKHFLGSEEEVDVIEWLSAPNNLVLENDRGDLGLMEYGLQAKKVHSCHCFFKSRGRAAITAAHEFLDELFNTCYNVDILMTMTPIERREVRWLCRQVGFKSYGLEEARGKQYELFILTKKEFNNE